MNKVFTKTEPVNWVALDCIKYRYPNLSWQYRNQMVFFIEPGMSSDSIDGWEITNSNRLIDEDQYEVCTFPYYIEAYNKDKNFHIWGNYNTVLFGNSMEAILEFINCYPPFCDLNREDQIKEIDSTVKDLLWF